MIPTTLKEIALWCGGTVEKRHENIAVAGLCHDSRELRGGDLFFALMGQTDGHRFLEAARNAGAAAAVVSHDVEDILPVVRVEDTRLAMQQIAAKYRESLDATVVAVTGSVGKTTTRTMLSALMERKFATAGTIKNYNNDIGLPVTLGRVPPDREMLVLEMGMNHFGEISLLTRIGRPHMAVITNIGSMHIETLGSREGILKAKLEILEGLPKDGVCVFNGDEPMLWEMRDTNPYKTLYFGIDNQEATLWGSDVVLSEGRSEFRVQGMGQDFRVELAAGGHHNVYNALAAITAALYYGVPVEEIQFALKNYVNSGQRLQIKHWNGYTIIDDTYNAGPESTEAALEVLRETAVSGPKGKRIAVLGDMLELGNHANAEHYRIGRVAAYKADLILTYGPLSGHTVQGAVAGGVKQRSAMNFLTQEELSNVLHSRAKPGDAILFKGSRGMQMEKILKAFVQDE